MAPGTGWSGVLAAGVVGAVLVAGLLGSGVENPSTPPQSPSAQESRSLQSVDASALLAGIAGTPPVACELVVRSLGNRWGSSSVNPRVHPPLAGTPAERAVARWAWTDRPASGEAGVLLDGLESDDACVQRIAARLLGVMDDPGTVSRIVEMARTGAGSRRLAAIASLAHVSDPRAAAALGSLLTDGDPEVRRAAAWALAEAEDDDAVADLAEALRDGDTLLRENAAWGLGRIESAEALGPLEEALRDGSVGVRVNAAWALGQIEDAAAIPSLAAVVGEDAEDEVRRTAAWALGRIER